jgi:hypothetical protein
MNPSSTYVPDKTYRFVTQNYFQFIKLCLVTLVWSIFLSALACFVAWPIVGMIISIWIDVPIMKTAGNMAPVVFVLVAIGVFRDYWKTDNWSW